MIEYINTLFSEKSKVEASRMIGKEYPLTKLRECATSVSYTHLTLPTTERV